MKSYLTLKNVHKNQLPLEFQNDDVRYTEELVDIFIKEYTNPGDIIFDPFAGFGTTLKCAELLGRRAYGIEFLKERANYIDSFLKDSSGLIHGDALNLSQYSLPGFDLSITSPPFIYRSDDDNPFTSYTSKGQGYEAYLLDLKTIYSQIKKLMNPGAHIIIEVSNIKHDGKVTTLAWDIASALGQILNFQGEIIVNWDKYGYGYDHSYCLIFQ